MRSITAEELSKWKSEQRDFRLVDVREPWEHELFNIGGSLLPLGELMSAASAIEKTVPTVIYCEKGIRSVIAIQRLEALGFENLYNLSGGMKAWKESL